MNRQYVRIMCDECGTMYPHTFVDGETREGMQQAGWVRNGDERSYEDLCPDCAARVLS